MGTWRNTAASVVTASAVLLSGQSAVSAATPAPATQAPRQGFRAAAQIAADGYRQQRRRILLAYRESTRSAHGRLRAALLVADSPEERKSAWREYAAQTEPLRAAANSQMNQARAEFKAAVQRAREQFGVSDQPATYTTMR